MRGAPFVQRLRGYDVLEAGHRVRRLLPSPGLSMVGPFVLFDHFGPATLAPGEGVDIAPHGHAHLATGQPIVSFTRRSRSRRGISCSAKTTIGAATAKKIVMYWTAVNGTQ